MHEMSLCQGMLEVLEHSARQQGFSRVRHVWLQVGELAGVEPAALEFGFDVVMRGTLAEGAVLEIERVPGEGWCLPCGRSVTLSPPELACPHCGSAQIQVTSGTQMQIRELEVD